MFSLSALIFACICLVPSFSEAAGRRVFDPIGTFLLFAIIGVGAALILSLTGRNGWPPKFRKKISKPLVNTSWVNSAPITGDKFAMAQEWYFIQNEKRVGPFDEAELRSLLKKAEINPTTMVWNGEGSKPTPLGSTIIMSAALEPLAGRPLPPNLNQIASGSVPSVHKLLPLIVGLSGFSIVIIVCIVAANKRLYHKHQAEAPREPASNSWFSGTSKTEMDADANIVCHADAAQANAVTEFNRYVALCNSGNYRDCDSYTANTYRSNVESLKANFQRQDQEFYNKYGFTFSERYTCN